MSRNFRNRMSNSVTEAVKSVTAVAVEKKPAPLYSDVTICQALRIRRRELVKARTKNNRGVDWDFIGKQVGMTREWIEKKALEIHQVPKFELLIPIPENTQAVSVSFKAAVPNINRAVVEVLKTGERQVAWVKDNREIYLNEVFDCTNSGSGLSWDRELNNAVY